MLFMRTIFHSILNDTYIIREAKGLIKNFFRKTILIIAIYNNKINKNKALLQVSNLKDC